MSMPNRSQRMASSSSRHSGKDYYYNGFSNQPAQVPERGSLSLGVNKDFAAYDMNYLENGHQYKDSYPRATTESRVESIVVVGTGDLGRAITTCLVKAGYRVVIASRNPERHRGRVEAVGGIVDTFHEAVRQSNVIMVAIPYEGFVTLSEDLLRGKIVVDMSNRPLDYDSREESLAIRLQNLLPGSKVVKAFNTLSAYVLQRGLPQGSTEVPICSNDDGAKAKVIDLARKLGFSPVDFGSLSSAKSVEDIPLEFFPEWKAPVIYGFVIWLLAFLLLLFRMDLCPNFERLQDDEEWSWTSWEVIPLRRVHHSLGLTAITLLASCYLPGVLAAYIQLYRQTKYSQFPGWLDCWLKGRKNMGLIALFVALPHWILAILSSIEYFEPEIWHSLYYFCGAFAFVTMLILGVFSLPSVASKVTWREFSFVQSYLGWLCLCLALLHLTFMKRKVLISNEFVCIFLPEPGQLFIILPLITVLLKLPLLLPFVNSRLQKVRRGYEGHRARDYS